MNGELSDAEVFGTPQGLTPDAVRGILSGALGPGYTITSGYRSPQHNAAVGGVPNSFHTRGDGQAFDFLPPPGMSMADARARIAATGVPWAENLNEGDHNHVAWNAPAAPAAPKELSDDEVFGAQPAASGPQPLANFTVRYADTNDPVPAAQQAAYERLAKAGKLDPQMPPGSAAFPRPMRGGQGLAEPGEWYVTDAGEVKQAPGGLPTEGVEGAVRKANAFTGRLADDLTFGFADKIGAGLGGITRAATGKASDPAAGFSQVMDEIEARNRQDKRDIPVSYWAGSGAGMLGSGALLPELRAANLPMRLLQGAKQGAAVGALNAVGQGRGNLAALIPQAVTGAVEGAALGAPSHGLFGSRLPSTATADFDRLGINAPLAVVGSRPVQATAQGLMGNPLIGGALTREAEIGAQQTRDAVGRVAGAYGAADTPEVAGRLLNRANERSAALYSDNTAALRAEASDLANQFGAGSSRRAAGESVQQGVEQFARDRSVPGVVGAPSRATSFAAKADSLYDEAFSRLEREIADKDAAPVNVAQAPAAAPKGNWVWSNPRTPPPQVVGGSEITAPRTQGALNEMLGSIQSKSVASLVQDPNVKRVASALEGGLQAKDISFTDLRRLRTWVRNANNVTELRQNIGAANLQRLEGALTGDIMQNAEQLGSPAAAARLRRADTFYRAGQDRIQKALQPFADAPSGESAYDRIISAASNGSQSDVRRVTALRRSLSPNDWSDVQSSLVRRLGDSASAGEFSLDDFAKRFGRLTPEGRQAIFGGRTAGLARGLESLAARAAAHAGESPTTFLSETPGGAFQGLLAAARSKGANANVSDILAVRDAMRPEEWGDVAASTIHEMGRSAQAEGGFSPAKFVTEWNNLSPQGREAIFGGPGREGAQSDLNALVRVLERQKAAGKFYNYSQSGNALGAQLLGGGVVAGAAGSLMTGQIGPVLAAAAPVVGGRVMSRLLASPGFARVVLNVDRGPGFFERAFSAFEKNNPHLRAELEVFRQAVARMRGNAPAAVAGHDYQQPGPTALPSPTVSAATPLGSP